MNLSLVREYISLLDDQKGNPGHIMPCDIFRHLTSTGMEQQKAAVTAGIITVLGGMATNPSFPLIAKASGPQREAVSIPGELDPSEVLRQGGKGLLQQILAIAEALIIPKVSQGLERKVPVTRATRAKNVKSKGKGLFQVFDLVMQNKGFLTTILTPLLKNVLKA